MDNNININIVNEIGKKLKDDDREYLYVVLQKDGSVEKDSQLRPRIYQTFDQAKRYLKYYMAREEQCFIGVYKIENVFSLAELYSPVGGTNDKGRI